MVLMLTAAGSPGDRVSGLTLGADDYLAKPFHFPELVLRIRALARRRPAARARTLRAAGIELDPVRRTATRDGRQLDLSVKEFAAARSAAAGQPGLPEHRGPARTGLGRARRPVHQHRHGDHRPPAPQARRPTATTRAAPSRQPRVALADLDDPALGRGDEPEVGTERSRWRAPTSPVGSPRRRLSTPPTAPPSQPGNPGRSRNASW